MTEPSERARTAIRKALDEVLSDLVPIIRRAAATNDVLATLAAAGLRFDEGWSKREEESGWLIERGDSQPSAPDYWGWSDGLEGDDGPGLDWTPKHLDALRFARKLDAERYAQDVGWNNIRICEHGWYGPCAGEHEWFKPDFIAYECCRLCGIVKRADEKNRPCKGPVSDQRLDEAGIEKEPNGKHSCERARASHLTDPKT